MRKVVPTGIRGLDQLMNGGFPARRCILVSGTPGTGKTTISSQFLYHGIVDYNEPGVFVTLDQSPEAIIEDMMQFGLDLQGLVNKRKLVMVDASPMRGDVLVLGESRGLGLSSSGIHEFSVEGLVDMIKEATSSCGARRIVIDPLTGLMVRYSDNFEKRIEMIRLLHELSYLNCTVLLTSESLTNKSFEAYITDGVITLRILPIERGVVKVIQVSKLRGSKHDPNPHPYVLTDRGIVIHAQDEVFTYIGGVGDER